MEKDKAKNTALGCFTLILLLAIGLGVLSLLGGNKEKGPKPEYDKVTAWVKAQSFVKQYLKSPSTAKFPLISDNQITDHGNGVYSINSYVDSQNSFGAMIRTYYSCKVKYVGNDKWVIEDLKFQEP